MTRIITPSVGATSEAVRALLSNGIIVIPTSRWYMICVRADNQQGLEKIYRAKKRPASKQPLFVLPDRARVAEYFHIGRGARQLVDRLWPGELSMLLTWADQSIAGRFGGFDPVYAVAHTPTGVFGEIAAAAAVPLAATTANVSGPSDADSPGPAISPEEVASFIESTGIVTDVVIDAGICPAFIQTTIVDCRSIDDVPKIVRHGYVHERAVRLALS